MMVHDVLLPGIVVLLGAFFLHRARISDQKKWDELVDMLRKIQEGEDPGWGGSMINHAKDEKSWD